MPGAGAGAGAAKQFYLEPEPEPEPDCFPGAGAGAGADQKCHGSASLIKRVQEAFGDEAMGVAEIKFGFNCFKNGRESIESNTLPGTPSTSSNKKWGMKVRALVMANLHITVKEIYNYFGILYGSTQVIFTEDLGMRWVTAKFIAKLLTRPSPFIPFSPMPQPIHLISYRSFWPSMEVHKYGGPRTLLTRPPVTSGYSTKC